MHKVEKITTLRSETLYYNAVYCDLCGESCGPKLLPDHTVSGVGGAGLMVVPNGEDPGFYHVPPSGRRHFCPACFDARVKPLLQSLGFVTGGPR